MNKNNNSNIRLGLIYGLPILKTHINREISYISLENINNRHKGIELENTKNVNSKKANIISQTIINLSNKIINTNKSQLNLLNKDQFNLNQTNSESLKNSNSGITKINLNESNKIFMNELQYIKLIIPFNSKLASFTNHIFTFTNKPYKQINKNLHNLYIICKSAFLNMSSIISKPIISINPNLIKITLFYY
jgi:hypothetical protein